MQRIHCPSLTQKNLSHFIMYFSALGTTIASVALGVVHTIIKATMVIVSYNGVKYVKKTIVWRVFGRVAAMNVGWILFVAGV